MRGGAVKPGDQGGRLPCRCRKVPRFVSQWQHVCFLSMLVASLSPSIIGLLAAIVLDSQAFVLLP